MLLGRSSRLSLIWSSSGLRDCIPIGQLLARILLEAVRPPPSAQVGQCEADEDQLLQV